MDSEQIKASVDTATQIYDPVKNCVRPLAKPTRQLIEELAARLAAAEARIAKLESARKV
jgi:hypothetical protein